MNPTGITPILNVSNLSESFAWFERLGWRKGWDWGGAGYFRRCLRWCMRDLLV